ncbi:cytochrome P450 [Favolaschia claudopus]|uniref:Cytochrome P450 n=1 Tax=Favolaschia claudopus TaxID=2862362 RepID=A0AAW0CGA0_9AGAR
MLLLTSLPILIACAICVGTYLVFFRRHARRATHSLPPGPRPLPIVGNLFDMPRARVWETFLQWKELYGDVVYLNVLGRHIVFLNSVKATTELLEKRGTLYSDRPQFPLINLAGHQWNFGFMPYGKEWQSLHRTFSSQYNSAVALRSFYDAHRASVSTFLVNVLNEPKEVANHLRLRSAQVMFHVNYGISVTSWDHPLVRNAERVMEVVSIALSPSMWIVNPISFLNAIPRWLGGAVASMVDKWQADVRDLRYEAFAQVKESVEDGTAQSSFTANLLREPADEDVVVDNDKNAIEKEKDKERLIRDTAAIALGVFLLMMALHPTIQLAAQIEIDSVLGGTHRLPDFSDRERLPYITAVMKECLRFHSPAPTGIPHELAQDDVYEGMWLPKGCMVMGNIWQLLHDPEMYPDPFTFNPGRFIDEEGKLDCTRNDPSRFAFGFGRRGCPGRLFTEDSLWLMTAQFLAAFTISLADGASREARFAPGAISRPLPFDHIIKPRSLAAGSLIEHLQDAA